MRIRCRRRGACIVRRGYLTEHRDRLWHSPMTETLQLRPFELSDADTVGPWLVGPGLSAPKRGKSAGAGGGWPERMVRDQRIVALVALAGGHSIGLVRLDCAPDGVAEITMVVAPEHRRSGLGRQIFSHALERAREVGMRRLCAYIDMGNEPALSFFSDVGFESCGVAGSRIRLDRLVHAGGRRQPPLDVGV
ncbi:MAG: N-acetyltransferase family protein [Planctomycetota bacterium]